LKLDGLKSWSRVKTDIRPTTMKLLVLLLEGWLERNRLRSHVVAPDAVTIAMTTHRGHLQEPAVSFSRSMGRLLSIHPQHRAALKSLCPPCGEHIRHRKLTQRTNHIGHLGIRVSRGLNHSAAASTSSPSPPARLLAGVADVLGGMHSLDHSHVGGVMGVM